MNSHTIVFPNFFLSEKCIKTTLNTEPVNGYNKKNLKKSKLLNTNYFKHYQDLVSRIDDQCKIINEDWQDQIVCSKGCDECCRHISVFPVEAISMALAMKKLSSRQTAQFQTQAEIASDDSPCPLLENGACMIYQARPVICRTHGLPILSELEDQQVVDYCPKNFTSVDSLPGNAFLSIDNINIMLATVNQHFIEETAEIFTISDRISIANILKISV